MFAKLFKRSNSSDVPQELYGSVVAQARQTAFFTDYGFQDSVTGRYDLVCLHLFLFSRRMVREDTDMARNLNQEVFDRFTDETDRALRELGVGDTTVPKRKKRMIHSFYAIVEELSPALDSENGNALTHLLNKRFAVSLDDDKALPDEVSNGEALSSYLMKTVQALDNQPIEEIMAGKLAWLSPADFV